MNEAFGNLPKEKQEKILNAALVEFARHGYKKASTDNIVREAGIGKGMLFYYFSSKRELYIFLVEYAITCCEDSFSRMSNPESGDLIEHFRMGSKLKLEAYIKYPAVMEFIGTVYLNSDGSEHPPGVMERLERILTLRASALGSIYERVDTSLFREDFPPEKIIRYIQWSMDGYLQSVLALINGTNMWEMDLEPYFKEFDEYLDDLKTIFYK